MTVNVFWFRRDLRVFDNTGFAAALSAGLPVVPIFIFDSNILKRLADKDDPRVSFIHEALVNLNAEMKKAGSGLHVYFGKPTEVFAELLSKFQVNTVFTNHDYEPYAKLRDIEIKKLLAEKGAHLETFKDQVIFERSEVVKDDGKPYSVFTPYSRKWKSLLSDKALVANPSQNNLSALLQKPGRMLSLNDIGFLPSSIELPKANLDPQLLKKYEEQRNFPAIDGTTRLGVHLRFGTVSVREMVRLAQKHSETWLNELIWREFFMQILYHYPETVTANYKKNFAIQWRDNPSEFTAWCEGRTGYPLVDAGMRELNATGFMHNRVRMVTASFLCKHLLIDWRKGERYFARKLFDFDLSSNVGNWQWVAGSGSDAAPYFRIFNPESQAVKFDKKGDYIRQWVPELGTTKYPSPIIDHAVARRRALAAIGVKD